VTLSHVRLSTHTLVRCVVHPDSDDHGTPDADDRDPFGCQPHPIRLAFTLSHAAQVRVTVWRRAANGGLRTWRTMLVAERRGRHAVAFAQSLFPAGRYRIIIHPATAATAARAASQSLTVILPQ
jgi:hypothetical protein